MRFRTISLHLAVNRIHSFRKDRHNIINLWSNLYMMREDTLSNNPVLKTHVLDSMGDHAFPLEIYPSALYNQETTSPVTVQLCFSLIE